MSAFQLPDDTRIRHVHLRVRELDKALGFYRDVLGFQLAPRSAAGEVGLHAGQGPAFLVLSESPDAPRRPARRTGLYHAAFRYPARRALANALARLAHHRYPINGASDHIVSEAIYLNDPEGNGVELYVDRPREQWSWRDGQVVMATKPLDLDGLLATGTSAADLAAPPPETGIGHIHLHVADLHGAESFYHDFLGLEITQRGYPGALFLSAGGYHHHLAVNTWAGATPPPPDSTGLISYRFAVPEAEVLYCLGHRAPLAGYETAAGRAEDGSEILRIRDPNGNWLELETTR